MENQSNNKQNKKLEVLVVEDRLKESTSGANLLNNLKANMNTKYNFIIHVATSVDEARKKIRATAENNHFYGYDLVLTDMGLPCNCEECKYAAKQISAFNGPITSHSGIDLNKELDSIIIHSYEDNYTVRELLLRSVIDHESNAHIGAGVQVLDSCEFFDIPFRIFTDANHYESAIAGATLKGYLSKKDYINALENKKDLMDAYTNGGFKQYGTAFIGDKHNRENFIKIIDEAINQNMPKIEERKNDPRYKIKNE